VGIKLGSGPRVFEHHQAKHLKSRVQRRPQNIVALRRKAFPLAFRERRTWGRWTSRVLDMLLRAAVLARTVACIGGDSQT
jgi:hypothetical protein